MRPLYYRLDERVLDSSLTGNADKSVPEYIQGDPGIQNRNPGPAVQCLATSQLLHPRYITGFKQIEKINATAPQPQRNVLKYFAIFKNIAHSLELGETPSYSASHQAPNYVQRS